ncbi:hypothetical protein C3496_12265 [Bacillus anthracis]|uniref:putative phage abortive infection protein n=1 Tax=Bacillus TaxID=1386 RepID=UPI0010A68475|nr:MULTISPECIES: putative phage abortive infection protein [Bacillus]QBJ67097.1 hypothetical protein C3496_12265 [Bacillus anthracis]THG62636.1 hypothetical protein E7Y01_02440 [Bacillus sp. HUB-I-004]
MANTDKEKDIGARFLTGIGIILLPMAILMPWVVVHFDLKSLGDFGAVGDFIGGTTVTFLTGASVFLLIATNIMQRKELQMSRKSVDEMVKQTKASVEQMAASVEQAEEARKETQITNETMKRQQFETTFFNMINLQHNILKEIQYGDYVGREAIYMLYRELKNTYDNQVYERYKTKYINNITSSEDSDNPLAESKHEAYEALYKRHENVIGHYYRNLYRIVKLIQNNTFNSESQELDNEEKRQYRGILRAQLSSFELLMLFYNISYSEKGKKFKELVAGINFFDDHLIEEDFIWKNDVAELVNLNKYKYKVETNSFYK